MILLLNLNTNVNEFTELYKKFVVLFNVCIKTDYNVFISLLGAVDKNNMEVKIIWGKYYITVKRKNHMVEIWWDNGKCDKTEIWNDIYGNFTRNELTLVNDEYRSIFIKW